FLSQKGSGVGKGVKEKQSSLADKSFEVNMHVNEALGSNSDTRTTNVVNAGLGSFPTLSEAYGNHSPASANEENTNDTYTVNNDANNVTTVGLTPAGNGVVSSPAIRTSTPGMSTLYANVTGEPSRKSVNFGTLITPAGNGVDVDVRAESISAISEHFVMTYGFFWGKRMAYPIFSFMDGLDAMLEYDPWFIRNNPHILNKWNLNVHLLKEDDGNVSVWVKLHGVPTTAFSEDGLSAVATKLDTLLMLDSYTSNMFMQSWGRSSYARAMIELQADVELKDIIVVRILKKSQENG
ncbi:putative reverse transcriptase domain-containing protein, partial [Tanacetum coccineum]